MRPPERTLMNERIPRFYRELVVINEHGENLGTMDADKALALAHEAELDLVLVNQNVRPPVARIVDHGKYQYEQEKREREGKKKKTVSELKAVRMRPGTDDHDLDVKLRNVIRFLNEGHKVKCSVMFRSREITRPEMGRQALERFVQATQDIAVVEREPSVDGRFMIMILAPKPGVAQAAKKAQEAEKAEPEPETSGEAAK